jgi:hypothetical protein
LRTVSLVVAAAAVLLPNSSRAACTSQKESQTISVTCVDGGELVRQPKSKKSDSFIKAVTVTRAPKSGVARIAGRILHYAPKPGFKGRDSFSVRVERETRLGDDTDTDLVFQVKAE